MQFTPEVIAALQTLKNAAGNDFERHRIAVLEKDLTEPPVVEIIDDTHQKFDGVTFRKNRDGHYLVTFQIHRAIFAYYNGEIPPEISIHHDDENKANNNISNLIAMPKSEHNRLHMKKTRSNMQKKDFVCAHCGKNFQAFDTGNNKFCSLECKKISSYNNQMILKKCKRCGKEIKTRKYYNADYCRSCAKIISNEKNQERVKCPVCGQDFSKPKNSNKIYCSSSCKNKAERVTYRENRICIICGKEFETDKYHQTKCCSASCATKYGRQKN